MEIHVIFLFDKIFNDIIEVYLKFQLILSIIQKYLIKIIYMFTTKIRISKTR